MIKFFRQIRQRLLTEGKTGKYLKYAIGEIILVVIGILIALGINNWNETKKERKYEHYILTEIRNNLSADEVQIQEILTQRQKTQKSIKSMRNYLKSEEVSKDSFSYDLGQLFTFERYFPIRTAYEVSKSRGLPISNPELRTQIANYYEYEQFKVQSSIKDIENVFLNEFQVAYENYLANSEYGVKVAFTKYPNPELNEWVLNELISFRQNNFETTEKVRTFKNMGKNLLNEVDKELQKFEKK
ncbi:DUF6090 family protein [Flagellimonas sp. DF-77]|uniref:DUF6090 family protein n=1 Tax=Flagellimonas algarum TaxID=3230298 RepID=UPI003390F19D